MGLGVRPAGPEASLPLLSAEPMPSSLSRGCSLCSAPLWGPIVVFLSPKNSAWLFVLTSDSKLRHLFVKKAEMEGAYPRGLHTLAVEAGSWALGPALSPGQLNPAFELSPLLSRTARIRGRS